MTPAGGRARGAPLSFAGVEAGAPWGVYLEQIQQVPHHLSRGPGKGGVREHQDVRWTR